MVPTYCIIESLHDDEYMSLICQTVFIQRYILRYKLSFHTQRKFHKDLNHNNERNPLRQQKVNKDGVWRETSLMKTFHDASQEAHAADLGVTENVTLV